MNTARSQIWLALRLPELALMVQQSHEPNREPSREPSHEPRNEKGNEQNANKEQAQAVIAQQHIICLNEAARAEGIELGMDATTAQLLTRLSLFERDQAKERQALANLCKAIYQFTPHIEVYESRYHAESGLLLEVSSCVNLFSNLNNMKTKIGQYLKQHGYHFKLGTAHCARAAWYLSYYGDGEDEDDGDDKGDDKCGGDKCSGEKDISARINRLPLSLLYDYPKQVFALKQMGFRTFGDVSVQLNKQQAGGPSAYSLHKRIGAELTQELCQVLNITSTQTSLFTATRPTYAPPESFKESLQFDYPISNVTQLQSGFESLLIKLTDYLRKHQQQCQDICWEISDIYHSRESVTIECDKAQVDWKLLYDLTLIKFENKELSFEVDTLSLSCQRSMPISQQGASQSFAGFAAAKGSSQVYAEALTKLKTRLGKQAVYKVSYQDNRMPELSNAIIALGEKCCQALPEVHQHSLRPTWLLTQPELIQQRGSKLFWQGYLTLLSGPERIIGEWWNSASARDYFLAKRHDNTPVWIYFDLYTKQWYAHGVFA